jgi:hypothetical protein
MSRIALTTSIFFDRKFSPARVKARVPLLDLGNQASSGNRPDTHTNTWNDQLTAVLESPQAVGAW